MPLVVTSDIHAAALQDYATYDGWMNSRLKIACDCITFAADHAKGGELVINGDLFHNREKLGIDVIAAVTEAIDYATSVCDVILSSGNHDCYRRDGSISSLNIFRGHRRIHLVPPQGKVIETGEGKLAILPHTVNTETVKKFCQKHRHHGWKCILILHQGIEGAWMGNHRSEAELRLEDLCAHDYKFVFLGDYHRPQQLDENVFYAGSPAQQNWGEAGEQKRILVVDDGQLASVPTNMPEFRRLPLAAWQLLDDHARLSHFYMVELRPGEQPPDPAEVVGLVRFIPTTKESEAVQFSTAAFDPLSAISEVLTAQGRADLIPTALARCQSR